MNNKAAFQWAVKEAGWINFDHKETPNPVCIVTYDSLTGGEDYSIYWGVELDEAKRRFEASGSVTDDGITAARITLLHLADELHIQLNPLKAAVGACGADVF